MKKVFFIAAMALMMATGCNQQKQEQQNMDKENNELTAFDVQKAFEKNGFSWFTENLLVCSGDSTQSNAMVPPNARCSRVSVRVWSSVNAPAV